MQQLLSFAGILILSFTVEKCRQLMSEDLYSSRSREERFTFTSCLDMSYGTIACLLKEIIKLYLYYIRVVYVQRIRAEAAEKALRENLSKQEDFDHAVEAAREEGRAAARKASWKAKHVMEPAVSAGWDLFETMYLGGSVAEGIVSSAGTFFGAYAGGIIGEGKIGWLGFIVGSWIGGRVGLMGYDVGNGVQYLLQKMS